MYTLNDTWTFLRTIGSHTEWQKLIQDVEDAHLMNNCIEMKKMTRKLYTFN